MLLDRVVDSTWHFVSARDEKGYLSRAPLGGVEANFSRTEAEVDVPSYFEEEEITWTVYSCRLPDCPQARRLSEKIAEW